MNTEELNEAIGQVEAAHKPLKDCQVVVKHKDDEHPATTQGAYYDERTRQFVIEL
jgi:hypothetical protein